MTYPSAVQSFPVVRLPKITNRLLEKKTDFISLLGRTLAEIKLVPRPQTRKLSRPIKAGPERYRTVARLPPNGSTFLKTSSTLHAKEF